MALFILSSLDWVYSLKKACNLHSQCTRFQLRRWVLQHLSPFLFLLLSYSILLLRFDVFEKSLNHFYSTVDVTVYICPILNQ